MAGSNRLVECNAKATDRISDARTGGLADFPAALNPRSAAIHAISAWPTLVNTDAAAW
jgi:hypothetical protein